MAIDMDHFTFLLWCEKTAAAIKWTFKDIVAKLLFPIIAIDTAKELESQMPGASAKTALPHTANRCQCSHCLASLSSSISGQHSLPMSSHCTSVLPMVFSLARIRM
ncbi:hypothetical protein CEXT_142431 [Caerostris extrusa]|uniref:Uncharacterized protein n=1 Tax=Caerostris extrusa TaxID=172846 RepID=A0AAV4UKY0_CAEEX|nr:hypothetical protein CEXT_142431 [Caerostris extrusa]